MAAILCVWEQGGSLGHLSHLRLAIKIALELGHEVTLAARELHQVPAVFGTLPVVYLQAPFKQNVVSADQAEFLSYTHLIARQCFSNVDELEVYLRAWRTMFALVKPAMVLFEHSPTALIASRSLDFKRVLVGSGFSVPPAPTQSSAPFAPFMTTPQTAAVLNALCADDAQMLKTINLALVRVGASGYATLPEIYAQADERFLMTWAALDHFGARAGQTYLGIEAPGARAAPQWPPGGGPKVFAYLQAIPALERLLQDLRAAGVCALLYVHGLSPRIRQAYTSAQLHFTDHLVDLSLVAQQAAWVINNGNHSTVGTFMRAGTPQLVIPLHQEQLFVSLRLVAHGGAVMAYQDQAGFAREIAALVSDPGIRQGAAAARRLCASPESVDTAAFIRQSLQALLA